MMQAIAQGLARLCIWIVGLPSVSLEARRAEAAKEARNNVMLAIGYRDELEGDSDAIGQPGHAQGGGDAIEARGIGFGEYLLPECDCEGDDDDGNDGRVRA